MATPQPRLPGAEAWAQCALQLPLHGGMSQVQAERVVDEVRRYCPFPEDECRGERLGPDDSEGVWWIRLRLEDIQPAAITI